MAGYVRSLGSCARQAGLDAVRARAVGACTFSTLAEGHCSACSGSMNLAVTPGWPYVPPRVHHEAGARSGRSASQSATQPIDDVILRHLHHNLQAWAPWFRATRLMQVRSYSLHPDCNPRSPNSPERLDALMAMSSRYKEIAWRLWDDNQLRCEEGGREQQPCFWQSLNQLTHWCSCNVDKAPFIIGPLVLAVTHKELGQQEHARGGNGGLRAPHALVQHQRRAGSVLPCA